MREGRCISLIGRLKQGSELKSTLSIGKLFQRFMTRSVKKLDLTELLQQESPANAKGSARQPWYIVRKSFGPHLGSVSYTHLTLPTNREV